MTRRRTTSLDRLLGRVDDLDSANLAVLVHRLARERDLLEMVFNTVREGVLITDEQAVIRYANRAGAAQIGLNPADLGKAVLWKWAPALARTFPFGLAGAAGVSAREIEIAYPERRILRVQVTPLDVDTPPVADEGGRRFVIILLDITEDRVSLEDRIEDERANSIFTLAAGVAHEIGNPLNSMNIHLQLMQRAVHRLPTSPERTRITDSVEVCAAEIRRLDGILKNFLEAIRPRAPDFQEVNLLHVVDEVLAVQREAMTRLGIRVELTTGTDSPVVSGDRGQLVQVFFNILKNAMEAMPKGGLVTLTTEEDDEFVGIRITDTGVGIEREAVARVFDPFYSTKEGGHGLGMMIVMRILRAHGGQVGVDSAPGVGTTVSLRFPRKDRRVRLIGAGS